MKANPVVVEEVLNAPAEKVWQAITDKEKMKHWYFNLDEFKPEIGFEFSFPGQGHQGESYMHLCKVTEVIPNKKLQYSWRYQDHPGNSLVTFELFPHGDQTKIRLTHEGLESFPATPDFARESFNTGWNELIGKSLPKYLDEVLV